MRLCWALGVLAALLSTAQAAEPSNASDYRIYGYLSMSDTNCPQSVIGVCEELLLLRMSSTDITLAPSKTPPLGKYRNRTIGCPSAHGTWEGGALVRYAASGAFILWDVEGPANTTFSTPIPFTLTQSGTNGLVLSSTYDGQFCMFDYTVTEATNYILNVAPLKFISVFSSAHGPLHAPAALLLALAAALAGALAIL